MTVKFTNNVKTKVAVSVTSEVTVIVVEDVSRFPTLGPGEYTYCTLTDTAKPDQTEICEVIGINAPANELTVVRGKEGTAQQGWRVGSNCELRLTAELLTRAIQDGTQGWDDIEGIPDTFPPEEHTHDQYLTDADSDGKQYARQDGAWSEVAFPEATPPSWDEVTGKPTEFPPSDHTHPEFDELGDRIDAIEDAITEDGGFVDAPDDGKLYGRQSENWAEVVIPDVVAPDWDSITGKPTEFPPADHTHVIADITDFDPADYQPAGDYLTDAASDGKQYARQDGAWAEVVAGGGGDGNATIISDTAPENATEGDLWFCSLAGSEGLFCFSDDPNGGDGYWFETSSNSGGEDVDLTGYATETYVDESIAAIEFPEGVDLTGYATETYVDDSIAAIPPTDFTGYATETYVDDSIAAIDIPDGVDLTGYATETYVDDSIAAIPPTDLTGYATETYVDDSIAAIPPTDLTGYATETYVDDSIAAIEFPAGAGMVISATEPVDRVEGTQWLNSDTAEVFIFDGSVWLEFPAGSSVSGGGLWTDNGGSISYSGNVSVSDGNLSVTSSTDTAIINLNNSVGNYEISNNQYGSIAINYNGNEQFVLASNADVYLKGKVYAPSVQVNGDLLAAKPDAGGGAVAVGYQAGLTNQGASATAVGYVAGYENQSEHATALGRGAGYSGQGDFATAIGRDAAVYNQGSHSVAIGYAAGYQDQPANSVIISATGTAKNVANPNCVWIGGNDTKRLYYNGTDEWSFAGGILKVDGVPVTRSTDLIKTLATLRNATKDETTLEGMRDALADAIGGLIQGLEHEIATQEISE
jgi:hypothetical protein